MKVIYNTIIPFRGFKAINICGILFARKGSVIRQKDLNHESIHTAQIKELGYVFFYMLYCLEWFCKLFVYGTSNHKAYRNISFEREAYNNEYDYDYLSKRKHYNWINLIFKC